MKYFKLISIIIFLTVLLGCKKDELSIPDKAINEGSVLFYTYSDYRPVKIYVEGVLLGTLTKAANPTKFECSSNFGLKTNLYPGQYSVYAVYDDGSTKVDMSYSLEVKNGYCNFIEVFGE